MILMIIILVYHYYSYKNKELWLFDIDEIEIKIFAISEKCYEEPPCSINMCRGSLGLNSFLFNITDGRPGGQAVFKHFILTVSIHLLSIVCFV